VHVDPVAVLLCQQDEMIDLLRGLTLMTETTGETIDQGFADLDAGQDDIEAKLDALTAEEERELAFLATLEQQRGEGQLAPDQQARLDDLKARQQKVSAALDAAREELAQADGSEPAPVSEPQASDTPIADSISTSDGMASGVAPVVVDDAPEGAMVAGSGVENDDEEPASNET
jgi:hypothetical protein